MTPEQKIKEAAEEYGDNFEDYYTAKDGFIAGVKSEAAKEYWISKESEELIKYSKLCDELMERIESLEYDIKKMYTEEEVFELLHKYEDEMTYYGRDPYYRSCFPEATSKWFENNKKK